MQEYWNDVQVIDMIRFVTRNPEYCLNINDGDFHIDRQSSEYVASRRVN